MTTNQFQIIDANKLTTIVDSTMDMLTGPDKTLAGAVYAKVYQGAMLDYLKRFVFSHNRTTSGDVYLIKTPQFTGFAQMLTATIMGKDVFFRFMPVSDDLSKKD